MIFKEILAGAYLIKEEKKKDQRGFFARSYCKKEFNKKKIKVNFVNANHSLSKNKYTLRGFHYQIGKASEDKIIRCIKGSFYNVTIDLRKNSKTKFKWYSTILSSKNSNSIFVPRGCANAILTLEDNTELFYLVSNFYSAKNERGIKWNDNFFNVIWPAKPKIISTKDQNHPNFDPKKKLIFK